ncbi:hypothetical protein, partial [Micromonospora psammae]|uniref:hypothetical protein n=1 Tax=Micromonospora sp. CPCC 205556 TaxID=3122398 RepID=UPI002FEEE8D9
MAHGEAEHGCAQGEPCRPGHHEQPGPGRPHRRVSAAPFAAEPAGRADEDPTLPRQRAAEPALPDPSAPRQRPGEPPAAEETIP